MDMITDAKTYFQRQFPDCVDAANVNDRSVQQDLWQRMNASETPSEATAAELCLRCFISHQVDRACWDLSNKFGDRNGFTHNDLLPFVLDDHGRSQQEEERRQEKRQQKEGQPERKLEYRSLFQTVLSSFNPEKALLQTWVNRHVKQHPELRRFLIEHGVYLVSDWAILNDTKPTQLKRILLKRILTDFYQFASTDIGSMVELLISFHAVYRNDRLQQRLSGRSQACQPPTPEQLNRIADDLYNRTQTDLSSQVILKWLSEMATNLRDYRIASQGGPVKTISLEEPGRQPIADPNAHSDEEVEQIEFLKSYRSQFKACLVQAIKEAVSATVQRKRPPKDQAFLTALHLFHCQGQSMSDIAPQVGLTQQCQVTRLLELKNLRADIRQRSLALLRDRVMEYAKFYADVECLQRLEEQVDLILEEEIDKVMGSAASEAMSPVHNQTPKNILAHHLCHYLDTRNTNP
jgi:hypothetical protein